MANSSVVSSSQSDVTSDVVPYEVRHVVATFDNVSLFEDAFEMLEQARFHRSRLSMIASHDAVIKRLGHLYTPTGEHLNEDAFPTALFTDRHDIVGGRTLAIGLPVYIGGAATGLAVVATGGTLAFAALIAAAGAAAGGGIGSIIANALSKHHADYLAKQLAMGSLLLGVDVDTSKQEDDAIYLLKKAGGKNVNAHTITRYWDPRRAILNDFDPYPYVGMTGYGL